jgi:hypothetical protein
MDALGAAPGVEERVTRAVELQASSSYRLLRPLASFAGQNMKGLAKQP